MNINKAFSGSYLKAADLDEDTTYTIDHMEMTEFPDGEKPTLYFEETDKGMVLNKTNATSISRVLGTSETDEWAGKQITLFTTTVDFSGKQVEAIRVKVPRGTPWTR